MGNLYTVIVLLSEYKTVRYIDDDANELNNRIEQYIIDDVYK